MQVGAQVMLLRNLDMKGGAGSMLVNGSRGVVTGFKSREVSRPPPHLTPQDTFADCDFEISIMEEVTGEGDQICM